MYTWKEITLYYLLVLHTDFFPRFSLLAQPKITPLYPYFLYLGGKEVILLEGTIFAAFSHWFWVVISVG